MGGGSFGGSSFGGMSLMGGMGGGSRSTNWKPPANSQDDQAVSGLLAEVEKLTGKHVKKHHAHQENSNDAQQPAFMKDFDDDDDNSGSDEDSHRQRIHDMGWGQVIPGAMGGGMSAIQQPQQQLQPAAPAPEAVQPPPAAVNSYLTDL